MADVTFEQVLESARALSPEEQQRLIKLLDAPEPIRPRKSLAQIVAEQGKKPLNYQELRKLGEFFPADESVDDLINFVYESRREGKERSSE